MRPSQSSLGLIRARNARGYNNPLGSLARSGRGPCFAGAHRSAGSPSVPGNVVDAYNAYQPLTNTPQAPVRLAHAYHDLAVNRQWVTVGVEVEPHSDAIATLSAQMVSFQSDLAAARTKHATLSTRLATLEDMANPSTAWPVARDRLAELGVPEALIIAAEIEDDQLPPILRQISVQEGAADRLRKEIAEIEARLNSGWWRAWRSDEIIAEEVTAGTLARGGLEISEQVLVRLRDKLRRESLDRGRVLQPFVTGIREDVAALQTRVDSLQGEIAELQTQRARLSTNVLPLQLGVVGGTLHYAAVTDAGARALDALQLASQRLLRTPTPFATWLHNSARFDDAVRATLDESHARLTQLEALGFNTPRAAQLLALGMQVYQLPVNDATSYWLRTLDAELASEFSSPLERAHFVLLFTNILQQEPTLEPPALLARWKHRLEHGILPERTRRSMSLRHWQAALWAAQTELSSADCNSRYDTFMDTYKVMDRSRGLEGWIVGAHHAVQAPDTWEALQSLSTDIDRRIRVQSLVAYYAATHLLAGNSEPALHAARFTDAYQQLHATYSWSEMALLAGTPGDLDEHGMRMRQLKEHITAHGALSSSTNRTPMLVFGLAQHRAFDTPLRPYQLYIALSAAYTDLK